MFKTLSTVLAACVLGVQAENVVTFTNVSVNLWHQWGICSNWIDSAENQLTVAPTNAADCYAVKLRAPVDGGTAGWSCLRTGAFSGGDYKVYLTYPAVDPSIDSISGATGVWDTWRWTLEFTQFTSFKVQQFKRVFTVRDPNQFDGWWTVNDAKATIKLTASTDGTIPTLNALATEARPYVDVADTGAIGFVSSSGTLGKKGAGELRVGPTQGAENRFVVEDGTLTLEGTADGDKDIAALTAQATLWLDATDARTIDTEPTTGVHGEALTGVAKWKDRNGNGRYGYFERTFAGSDPRYYFTGAHAPFISPVTSPTGKPLVDFGSKYNENNAYGPTNCWLRLNTTIDNVREAFYVVQTPGTAASKTVLGTVYDKNFAFLSDNAIFAGYSAGTLARTGSLMLNGMPQSYAALNGMLTTTLTNLNVLSAAIAPGGAVEMIAADRHYHTRSGGMRLGEILLYTNVLTRAERVRINRYLMRKWLGTDFGADAGLVSVEGQKAVAVPKGRTARVDVLNAQDGFVKRGEGTLELGHYAGDVKKIKVEAGSVGFVAPPTVTATDAPAADPYAWLDANDTDKFTVAEIDGADRTYVTAWADHRATSDLVALAVSNTPPRMPWIETDGVTGKKVVNLGVRMGNANDTQSFFILPTWGSEGSIGKGSPVTQDTYAGFIVFRPLLTSSTFNYFGCSNLELFRNSAYCLLSTTYCNNYAPAAYWSINGIPVDPWNTKQCATTRNTNDIVVVAFRSTTPLTVNGITKDRRQEQHASCGNIAVSEFITYHRPLTLEEVRATEAYLLKKWKGQAHPLAAQSEVNVTFAADVPQEVVADTASSFVTFGGNGTLVKYAGADTAMVTTGPDSVTNGITVSAGTLNLKINPFGGALFHLDAADTDSLTFERVDTGNGITTNVTAWADTRRNGFKATSMVLGSPRLAPSTNALETAFPNNPYPSFVMAHPTYETCETAAGMTRPAVFFGHKRNCTATAADTSSLDAAAMAFSELFTTMRDSFVVYGDTTQNIGGDFWGNETSDVRLSHYFRSGTSQMFNTTYASENVKDGYIARDGVQVPHNEKLGAGMHVISLSPLAATRIDSLMQERNCNAGGGRICEAIGLDYVLSVNERTFAERYLLKKWFDKGDDADAPAATLTMAGGANLVSDTALTVSVITLAGGGVAAVTLPKLTLAEQGVLHVAVGTDGAVPTLAIAGNTSWPKVWTVVIDLAEDLDLPVGIYSLVTGTPAIAFDLEQVTLDMPPLRHGNTARLAVMDGTLKLLVNPKGTVLFFR